MRRLIIYPLFIAIVLLSACDASIGAAPTPEAWTPPPAVTAAAATSPAPSPQAAPTATASAETGAPTATETAPVTTYTVQRGTIQNALTLSGELVSSQQRELSFTDAGTILAVHVDRGSAITKGQLIAELDPGDLTEQLKQAQNTYDKAKSAIDSASLDKTIAIRRAQIELDAANAKLARLQGPPDPVEVNKARAAVEQAQAKLDKTRNDASSVKNQAEQKLKLAIQKVQDAQAKYAGAYQNLQSLMQNKKSAPESRAAAQAALDAAQAELRAAEDAVASLQIDYDTARGNEIALVKDAEASLAIVQAELDGLLSGPDRAALDEAKQAVQLSALALEQARQQARPDPEQASSLKDAQQAIATLREQIEALRLYAPFDGQVVAVNAQQGATIEPGEGIILANDASIKTSDLQIWTQGVTDTTSISLTIGESVQVMFPGRSEKSVPGTIAGLRASSTAASADTGSSAGPSYIVKYDAGDMQLAAGEQAQVLVTLAQKDDALWLPPQALRTDGQDYVVVQNGSSQDRVNVQLGISSPDRIEVLNGLKEGDVVVGE